MYKTAHYSHYLWPLEELQGFEFLASPVLQTAGAYLPQVELQEGVVHHVS